MAANQEVCNGASILCSFGSAPCALVITPENRVLTTSLPAATIMDFVPGKNILPFGTCQTVSNPAVAAATTAASGVLTPQPCVPVVVAPWVPGSPTVMVAGRPALSFASKCACTWGGVISVAVPGQVTTMVP